VAVPLVLVVQAIDAWRSPQRLASAVALVASVLLALTFFIGYARNPAVPCFVFPDPHPTRYLPFAGLVLAHPLAFDPFRDGRAVAVLVSAVLGGAFAWSSWGVLRRPGAELERLVFLLCGSAVLFAAAVAVGRACLGVAASWAPRYVLYVLPALAAAALLLRVRTGPAGRWVTAALLIVVVGQQVGVEHQSTGFAELVGKKRRYVECLRAGQTATECTGVVGLEVYPAPALSHLDEKVEYMRERGLGPF
jgi:hypothetical protein